MPHHTRQGEEPTAAERRVQRQPAPLPRARTTATAARFSLGARVPPRPGAPAEVLALQGVVGNAAVMRLLAGTPAAVQRVEEREAEDGEVRRAERGAAGPTDAEVHAAAAKGVRAPSGPLPFLDRIQASFGRHSVQHVRAHVGAEATRAAHAMGARAFATGSHVAFADTPDPHTAAHEAAHVVQQQAGVQLAGGVGRAGDAYERHADAVADAVVAGRSAEALLEPFGASMAAPGPADPVMRVGHTEGERPEKAVQRTITLKGAEQDVDELVSGTSTDVARVIRTWHEADLVHDFENSDALQAAAENVKDKPEEVPDLYTKKNLRFITKAGKEDGTEGEAREPTLYFVSESGLSGRIRQQHRAGPLVKSQENKHDYFFASRADAVKFEKAARKAKKAKKAFNPRSSGVEYRLADDAEDGDFHCEVTYTQPVSVHTGGMVAERGVHRSQGQYVGNTTSRDEDSQDRATISDFDDERIARAYRAAVGRPEPPASQADADDSSAYASDHVSYVGSGYSSYDSDSVSYDDSSYNSYEDSYDEVYDDDYDDDYDDGYGSHRRSHRHHSHRR